MKTFRYEGGPLDQQVIQADESTFPQVLEDGEYRWSGASHGLGSGGQDGAELPAATRATATWHPNEEPLTAAEELYEKERILSEKRSPGEHGDRATKDEVREAFFDREDARKRLLEERGPADKPKN